MKILISGAGGFLGTEIVSQLAEKENVQLVALTSQEKRLREKVGDSRNVTVFDRNSVFESDFDFSDTDLLINCAFPRNADGIAMADGLRYVERLLEAAVAGGVKSVINISSQSVYSQVREQAANENTQLNPETKYAVGKYAAELLTNSLCRDIPHTNIRMASLIGAGFEQRLVNKLVKQVLAGNNLELKCGRQKFGFLDVRDAASGIISAAYGDSFKEVYNLGADLSYSLEEIARCVQATVEEEGLKRTDISLTETDDVLNSELDSSLFKEQFGWKPVYSLKDTVRSIIRAALS